MSIKESALKLVLKARDTLSRPVQQSGTALEKFRKQAYDLKKQLSNLEKQDRLLSSFQRQAAEVRKANTAYGEAKQKVERLAREYKQTDKPSKQLKRSLDAARKSVITANQAYHKQGKRLSELRTGLKQAGLSSKNIAEQQNRVQREIKQTTTAFKAVDEKARKAARSLKQNSLNKVAKDADRASGSLNNLARRFGAVVAASLGFYTIKRSVESILSTGDKFERLQVQLNAIMGSIEGGQQATEWIKQFTKDTPYQLEEVSEAFVRLKAFGLDPMDGTMQAVVDQASKLGGGMERLNGISNALGQAWAKQKLQGEEILQLVERGVPVWELLEKVTGKNVQELQKLSSAGKLGKETIALLIEEIGRGAEGAAAANMQLLSGYVSNLKDTWENFLDEIAKNGALDYAKNQLKAISDEIALMSEDGRLSKLAKTISDSFVGLAESVKALFADVTIESFTARIQTGFSGISSSLSTLKTSFETATNSVSVFFNGFSLAVNGYGAIASKTLASLTGLASRLFDTLGGDEVAAKLSLISESLNAASEDYKQKVKQDAAEINESLSGIYASFATKNEQQQQKQRVDNKKTIDELLGNYKKVEVQAEETGTKVKAAFADVKDALKQINAAETRTELADLGVALAEAFNQGVISQEEYAKALEASKEKLVELEEQAKQTADASSNIGKAGADGAKEASINTAGLAGIYNSMNQELHSLSQAAHDTFKGLGKESGDAKGEIADLKNELEETNQKLSDLSTPNFDVTGISDAISRYLSRGELVKKSYLEQKIAFEELMQSYEQGSISIQSFSRQAESASKNVDLLNEQDLDRLNSAIESASSSMQQLNQSSRSTLDGLLNELDQLQGRQDEVLRRQFESRQRDLNQQLEEARQGGDSESASNLSQALSVNQSIFQEKRRQEQQQLQQEREQQRPNQQTTQPQRQPASPQRTIRLEYPGGNLDVGVSSASDEAKLLEALKTAGMRSV